MGFRIFKYAKNKTFQKIKHSKSNDYGTEREGEGVEEEEEEEEEEGSSNEAVEVPQGRDMPPVAP